MKGCLVLGKVYGGLLAPAGRLQVLKKINSYFINLYYYSIVKKN